MLAKYSSSIYVGKTLIYQCQPGARAQRERESERVASYVTHFPGCQLITGQLWESPLPQLTAIQNQLVVPETTKLLSQADS